MRVSAYSALRLEYFAEGTNGSRSIPDKCDSVPDPAMNKTLDNDPKNSLLVKSDTMDDKYDGLSRNYESPSSGIESTPFPPICQETPSSCCSWTQDELKGLLQACTATPTLAKNYNWVPRDLAILPQTSSLIFRQRLMARLRAGFLRKAITTPDLLNSQETSDDDSSWKSAEATVELGESEDDGIETRAMFPADLELSTSSLIRSVKASTSRSYQFQPTCDTATSAKFGRNPLMYLPSNASSCCGVTICPANDGYFVDRLNYHCYWPPGTAPTDCFSHHCGPVESCWGHLSGECDSSCPTYCTVTRPPEPWLPRQACASYCGDACCVIDENNATTRNSNRYSLSGLLDDDSGPGKTAGRKRQRGPVLLHCGSSRPRNTKSRAVMMAPVRQSFIDSSGKETSKAHGQSASYPLRLHLHQQTTLERLHWSSGDEDEDRCDGSSHCLVPLQLNPKRGDAPVASVDGNSAGGRNELSSERKGELATTPTSVFSDSWRRSKHFINRSQGHAIASSARRERQLSSPKVDLPPPVESRRVIGTASPCTRKSHHSSVSQVDGHSCNEIGLEAEDSKVCCDFGTANDWCRVPISIQQSNNPSPKVVRKGSGAQRNLSRSVAQLSRSDSGKLCSAADENPSGTVTAALAEVVPETKLSTYAGISICESTRSNGSNVSSGEQHGHHYGVGIRGSDVGTVSLDPPTGSFSKSTFGPMPTRRSEPLEWSSSVTTTSAEIRNSSNINRQRRRSYEKLVSLSKTSSCGGEIIERGAESCHQVNGMKRRFVPSRSKVDGNKSTDEAAGSVVVVLSETSEHDDGSDSEESDDRDTRKANGLSSCLNRETWHTDATSSYFVNDRGEGTHPLVPKLGKTALVTAKRHSLLATLFAREANAKPSSSAEYGAGAQQQQWPSSVTSSYHGGLNGSGFSVSRHFVEPKASPPLASSVLQLQAQPRASSRSAPCYNATTAKWRTRATAWDTGGRIKLHPKASNGRSNSTTRGVPRPSSCLQA